MPPHVQHERGVLRHGDGVEEERDGEVRKLRAQQRMDDALFGERWTRRGRGGRQDPNHRRAEVNKEGERRSMRPLAPAGSASSLFRFISSLGRGPDSGTSIPPTRALAWWSPIL